jgi:hypothetical protein
MKKTLTMMMLSGLLFAADKPRTVLTELEMEKLKRISAELQLLQTQAQQQAEPKISEQRQIVERACKEAAIPVDKCEINPQTGAITAKIEKPEPAPDKAKTP